MSINRMSDFTFKWTDVPGNYMKTSAADTKNKLDMRDIQIRDYLISVIDVLNNEGASHLGAKDLNNISKSIQEILTYLLTGDKNKGENLTILNEFKVATEKAIDLIDKAGKVNAETLLDLKNTFDVLVINAGQSNAEVAAARYDNISNTTYSKLGDRLDKITETFKDVSSQMDSNVQEVNALKTNKVDKVVGKGLSTNDYDNTEKGEVAKIKEKANIVDVNNKVWNLPNMGQDVKQAMTGGSVAVVGKGSVLTETILPNQVTPITTTFFDIKNFTDLTSIRFTNQFVGTDGVVKSDVNTCSVILRVEPNTVYKLKLDGIVANRGYALGGTDGLFTTGSTYPVLGINILSGNILSFTTTSNTNYVFVYFTNAPQSLEYYNANKTKFKLYKNDVPADENEYIKKTSLPQDILYKELNAITPDITSFFDVYNKLLNNYVFVNGNCSTNGVVTYPTDGSSMIVSNINPNTTYYIKLPSVSNRAYILSSANSFTSGATYSVLTLTEVSPKVYKFTTNLDTSKLYVYFYNVSQQFSISDFSLVTDVSNLGVDYMMKKEYLPVSSDTFVGKKILTMGDSITAINEGTLDWDRSWRKYFKEMIRPSLFVNTAVPSATWRDKVGTIYDGNPVVNGADNNVNNVMGNQMEKVLRGKDTTHPNYSKVSDYDDFDMIIIACGTNDTEWVTPTQSEIEAQFFNGSTPITDLKTLDRKTWTGALRYTVDNLRRLYPNAKIYLCTPIQRTGNKYEPILAKNKIIKDITRRLSIDVIDSMVCGIYDMTCPSGGKEGDFNDGLHLSPQGASKLGKYIANDVKNKYY